MSLIKANAVQVGQSPTATQNFTLAVPSSPDGTIKLARGNSGATTQDVISVDASGNINGLVKTTGSTTARSLANRFADVVNVKDFGAVGDGVTDDTAAIQAAIDTGYDLIFPSGTYITSSQLTMNTAGQQLTALHPYPNEFGGAAIQFSHNGVCVLIQEAQCAITNLKFVGPDLTVDTAIKAAKLTNTDDIDVAVKNCLFKTCAVGINVIGRSLNASENLFANCTTCITLSWPTSGTSGTGDQALPLGWRATRILNNRAHSCTLFLQTTGADKQYFRGAVINANQMDIGERFFEGGIIDSVISNNVVEMANSTIIYIDSGGSELAITGNLLNGTSGDAAQSPARSIWFATGSTPSKVSITGNSMSYMDVDCIQFVPAAEYISIVGNYFGEAATRSISINGGMYKSSIVGNSFNPGTGLTCIDATGAAIADIVIFGNGFASAKTLLGGSPTDNGGNIIQTNGRVHFGSLIEPTRTLEASSSGSITARFSRTGSSSGLGFDFINTAGTINLFVTPTGSQAGSFAPGGDNAISNGTAAFRWSVVYAGTGAINTSDEREKQQARLLSETEKKVGIKLKSLVKAFKFNNAVEVKGEDARIHVGVIAQEVVLAFESEGLDATKYGLLCYDEWDEQPEEKDSDGNVIQQYCSAGNRYGIRYDQLLAFIISTI